jgi:hypothetical protein
MDKNKQIQYPHLLYSPIDRVICGIASVKKLNSLDTNDICAMRFAEYPTGNIIGDRTLIMILFRHL